MTFTKVLGSFCGALLIFLLGKWAAEELYHVGGHGYGEQEQAYIIDTGEEEATEEVVEIDLPTLLASADLGKGERAFRQCSACHQLVAGENRVGPYLYGVVGRPIGAAEGFAAYSGALNEAGDVWTAENLFAFLENPRGWAPGTSMAYSGMRKPEDRANLIAYLDSLDD